MEHESKYIEVDGVFVRCMAKIIGDHFRYFVNHYEFPFCSIDKPDEQGNHIARTCGETCNLGKEFNHEDVVRWAFNTIKKNSIEYYNKIKG